MSAYSSIVARPKSEERRAKLLEAAVRVFAEQGLAAPTSAVSRAAGVSEGSLFTYFATKDELVVALYRELKQDLAAEVMRDFPRKAGLEPRLEHLFREYVGWGVRNPFAKRALRSLMVSNAIAPEVRAEASPMTLEIDRMYADAVAQKRIHVPREVVGPTLKAIAEMTMELCERDPQHVDALIAVGFQLLWGALSSRP